VGGLAIAVLFMLMVAAPCLVALRNSRDIGDIDDFVPEEYEAEEVEVVVHEVVVEEIAPEPIEPEPLPVPVAARTSSPNARTSSPNARTAAQLANAQSLRDLAVEAEIAALMAKDRADRAHWEALTAAARAASLRADAASEAAQAASLAADRAMRAAETDFVYEVEYQPEHHPSLDFPRAQSGSRRAA